MGRPEPVYTLLRNPSKLKADPTLSRRPRLPASRLRAHTPGQSHRFRRRGAAVPRLCEHGDRFAAHAALIRGLVRLAVDARSRRVIRPHPSIVQGPHHLSSLDRDRSQGTITPHSRRGPRGGSQPSRPVAQPRPRAHQGARLSRAQSRRLYTLHPASSFPRPLAAPRERDYGSALLPHRLPRPLPSHILGHSLEPQVGLPDTSESDPPHFDPDGRGDLATQTPLRCSVLPRRSSPFLARLGYRPAQSFRRSTNTESASRESPTSLFVVVGEGQGRSSSAFLTPHPTFPPRLITDPSLAAPLFC